jgi:hypothetical protein
MSVDDKPTPVLTVLADLAGEWVEAVEAATAGIVAAEVAAFEAVLAPVEPLTPEQKIAQELAADAKAEEDFDNMPL